MAAAKKANEELGQLRVNLGERDRRIQALEAAAVNPAELAKLRAERDKSNSDLAASKTKCDEACSKLDARIAELEAQLKAAKAAEANMPEPAKRMAAWSTGAWKKGRTKIDTDGVDHADDLKEISGIGPQMEQLLNSFDIKSWEQLAAMSAGDVAKVDAVLTDFPGRITRDEWVPQAKAIMDNGHQPVKRAPKKRAPKKPAAKKAPSWAQGTTKLGTPGAGHKDDLKVVNGIGPKMEGLLNKFGVTAWEQLAALSKSEVVKLNEMIESFPGRIERDEWVKQSKDLCKRFPDPKERPTRKTFLNDFDRK